MNDFLQSLRNGQAEKQRTPKTRKNFDNSYQYTSNSRFNSYGNGGYPNSRSQQMKRPSHGMPHQGGNQIPAEDANMALLADVLDNLSSHVETLVKNQEYMVNVQERTADMLERQAIAIEGIINHLNLSPDMENDMVQEFETKETGMDEQPEPAFTNHYVTSREHETPEEDNQANKKTKPVAPPAVIQDKNTAIKSPTKKTGNGKPVLRKRRKIVAKEIVTSRPQNPTAAPAVEAVTAKLMPRDEIMDIIQNMRDNGATFDQVAKHLVDLGQPTFSGRGEWHAQTIHRLCSKKK